MEKPRIYSLSDITHTIIHTLHPEFGVDSTPYGFKFRESGTMRKLGSEFEDMRNIVHKAAKKAQEMYGHPGWTSTKSGGLLTLHDEYHVQTIFDEIPEIFAYGNGPGYSYFNLRRVGYNLDTIERARRKFTQISS